MQHFTPFQFQLHGTLYFYIQILIECNCCHIACRLDEALSNYLGPAQQMTVEEQGEMEMPLPVRKCPQCNCDMVLKRKKDSTG